MKLRTKVIYFIIINIVLISVLYYIPIKSDGISICIIKRITGNECWNCGMTRAFLSILHFDFKAAYQYNPKVIVVFPLTVGAYLCYWIKKIK